MKKFGVFFLLLTSLVFSQAQLNQFDKQGKRDGIWEKKYEGTNRIRYSGTFSHGKEVGIFKFYHKKGADHPSTIKQFNATDGTALVKHYTSTGKLVSEGKMKGKALIGAWKYYQRKSTGILTTEFYINGKLDGKRTTYYPNGTPTEEETYVDGVLQGERKVFSDKGVVIKHFNYVDGKLDGPVFYYDAEGEITIKGKYKMSKRVSVWQYYNKGKLTKEKDYTISKNPYKNKKKS